MTFTLQLQFHRFVTSGEPDFPNHPTGPAVVDFSAENLLFNAPCHAGNCSADPPVWREFPEGRALALWVNGAVTCRFEDCGQQKGYLGLEGEGYRIEFRNLKVKKLD